MSTVLVHLCVTLLLLGPTLFELSGPLNPEFGEGVCPTLRFGLMRLETLWEKKLLTRVHSSSPSSRLWVELDLIVYVFLGLCVQFEGSVP